MAEDCINALAMLQIHDNVDVGSRTRSTTVEAGHSQRKESY